MGASSSSPAAAAPGAPASPVAAAAAAGAGHAPSTPPPPPPPGAPAPSSAAAGGPAGFHHGAGGLGADACPVVGHKGGERVARALMTSAAGGAGGSVGAAGAPAPAPAPAAAGSSRARGPVYNVYSQEIDPANNMPAAANNAPLPGQAGALSPARVASSIPKGGTDGTWLYPSPQMFYNSLVRKGKADGVATSDMDSVIAIHNEMNERTWRALREWEGRHAGEHLPGEPALRRFQGNPWAPTPKARVVAAAGFGWPFDRHDWYVDRGGRLVHYVIDYYFNPHGPALAPADAAAAGARVTAQIHVDVRPAVDSIGAALDRLAAFPRRAAAALRRPRYVAEGLDPALAPPAAADAAAAGHGGDAGAGAPAPAPALSPADAAAEALWAQVDAKCAPRLAELKGAPAGPEGDAARRSASVALNYCMARALCPPEAAAFMAVLEANTAAGVAGAAGGREEEAFAAMTACVVAAARRRPAPHPAARQPVDARGAGEAAPALR